MPKIYFPRVKEAREALRERAIEIYEMQMRIIQEALAAQDFETAAKANQFLMTHLPPDEDGTKLLDTDIDAKAGAAQSSGPSIQIGFQLGGMPGGPKALPEVIDITPKKLDH